jgi:anti-sigma B factor antagonist
MKITALANNIHQIELSGRFDAHSAPQFSKELDALDDGQNSYVVVDLADVNFIDSTALAALVRSMKHYRQNNGEFYIVNLQAPVRIIFELTRMDRAFSIFPSVKDALADIES